NLLNGRSMLLTDEQQYYDAIENFKLQLGIPTDIPIALDDAPLRPILGHYRRYEAVFQQLDAASEMAGRLEKLEDVSKVRAELLGIFRTATISRDTRFRNQIGKRWAAWEKLEHSKEETAVTNRISALNKERQAILDKQADLELKGQQLSPAEVVRLREVEF